MFKIKQKNLIYLGILILAFFTFYSRSNFFYPFKFNIVEIVSGPIRFLSSPLLEMKKIIYYHRIFDEYRRLNKEVSFLKAQIAGMEEVIQENKRLVDVLDFKRKSVFSSVLANVIARNPSFWNSVIIIDKGRRDGIKEGLPVINSFGVVGKVFEVGERASKIILLTDSQFSVAALVQRSRETVLVTGSLDGTCRLRFIKENSDIQMGDKLITSKLSTSFPEGLLIGEVDNLTEDANGQQQNVSIHPTVTFSQLEEVLVILK